MYFIQWVCSNLVVFCSGCTQPKFFEQIWELHKHSYSYLCWIFVASVAYVSHLGSRGSIVIFMLEKP